MCVIFCVSKTRPTEEMVEQAWAANDDGFGIAWREGAEDKTEVHWQKGITDVEVAKELCATTPMPYVAHFRIASVGGVRQSLTHPFLVSRDASLALKGHTKGSVLFHNGHWAVWNDKALEAAINSNTRLPVGDWSDTRAMAWMVHIYGPGFMDILTTQKGVMMTPKRTEIFTGGGWKNVQGVWCSNDSFVGRTGSRGFSGWQQGGGTSRTCSAGHCTNTAMYNDSLCYRCLQDKKDKAAGKNEATKEEHTKSQSGSSIPTTMETNRPLMRPLTVSEMETLFKADSVSKGELKKIRKLYSAKGKGGNRAKRAEVAIQLLTKKVADRLLTGSAV